MFGFDSEAQSVREPSSSSAPVGAADGRGEIEDGKSDHLRLTQVRVLTPDLGTNASNEIRVLRPFVLSRRDFRDDRDDI